MKYQIINKIKELAKDKNELIYNNKDFKEYIKNRTTLNLYIDQLAQHITNYFNSKGTPNYTELGKAFLGLIAYTQSPTEYLKDLQELKYNTKDFENTKELIAIYNHTIIDNYKDHLNGKKGGAPKGNKNANKD